MELPFLQNRHQTTLAQPNSNRSIQHKQTNGSIPNEREINEGDIQFAAQFYKQFITQKSSNNNVVLEHSNVQPKESSFRQAQRRQSMESDPNETPYFHTAQQPYHQHNIDSGPMVVTSQNQLEVSKERFSSSLPQGDENSKDSIQAIPAVVGNSATYGQEATNNIDSQRKIKSLPLYGIAHSKQYFQAHPILSSRLKKYKDFVKDCEKITSINYQQGFVLNNQLTLTGPELCKLGLTVFKNVFRRMEQYLLNICKKKIVRLAEQDVVQLSQLMFDPNILDSAKALSLRKFMKLAFDIAAHVRQTEITALYTFMMKWLNQKNQPLPLDYDHQDHQDQTKPKYLWTRQREIQFCQLYLVNKSLALVTEILNQQSTKPKVNVFELKYKMEQLIRSTIKKIQKQIKLYDKNNEHWLVLTQKELKMIINVPKGLHLRLLLLNLNIKKYVLLQEIKSIITSLEQFLKYKGKNKTAAKTDGSNNQRVAANKRKKPLSESQQHSAQGSVQEEMNQKSSQKQQSESEQYLAPANDKKKASFFAYRNEPRKQTLLDIYNKSNQASRGQRRLAPLTAQNEQKKKKPTLAESLSKLKSGVNLKK